MAHSKTSVESPFRRNVATVATVRTYNFNLCLEFFYFIHMFLMCCIFIDLFSPFFFFFQVETVGMVKAV